MNELSRQQATGNRQQGSDAEVPGRNSASPSAVTLWETAPGKLNLTLDVLGKRADGYHELEMVMCSVSLSDELTLTLGTGKPWAVTCGRPGIPAGSDNLCWKAAAAYCETAGVDPEGLSIHIEKKIPAQAGMAGGSSDAAAVLRALNRHYGRLSEEALRDLGLRVGSDVPYCLFGGVALARGRGELLTRLPNLPQELWFVLAKPEFSVSTPALFREIDACRDGTLPSSELGNAAPVSADKQCLSLQPGPHAAEMISAIDRQDRNAIGAALQNDFEPLVASRFAIVEELRRIMRTHGALGARLTGTGSVVFGLFCSKYKATAAALELQDHCPEVFLTTALSHQNSEDTQHE